MFRKCILSQKKNQNQLNIINRTDSIAAFIESLSKSYHRNTLYYKIAHIIIIVEHVPAGMLVVHYVYIIYYNNMLNKHRFRAIKRQLKCF